MLNSNSKPLIDECRRTWPLTREQQRMEEIITIQVDYSDAKQCSDLIALLAEYAEFETDQSARTLTPSELLDIPSQLAEFPTAFSVLAYHGNSAIGLANCFFGFSTFLGRPLVNIHDIVVTEQSRGHGVAGKLLAKIDEIAIAHDCCRVTLEVLDHNTAARRAYEKHGFGRTPLHPQSETLFLQKPL